MGAIPPPPPPMRRSSGELHREFLYDLYQDRNQVRFPSEQFIISLLILSPWIISIILKLWMGEWRIYIAPPHW